MIIFCIDKIFERLEILLELAKESFQQTFISSKSTKKILETGVTFFWGLNLNMFYAFFYSFYSWLRPGKFLQVCSRKVSE